VEKRRAFLAEGVAKSARTQSGRKKEVWKDFQKKMNAKYFV
jgi:hypothetical protein